MKKAIIFVLTLSAACIVIAQPRTPNKTEIAALKKLSAQSVLHVETALKKIDMAGPTADQAKLTREIYKPAQDLLQEWKAFDLTDAVMFNYVSCSNILGDVQAYGHNAITPPKYHLSSFALQKRRFINEDLADCRRLRTMTPSF